MITYVYQSSISVATFFEFRHWMLLELMFFDHLHIVQTFFSQAVFTIEYYDNFDQVDLDISVFIEAPL